MRSLWVAAAVLAVAACGEVNKIADAGIDAFAPDAPMACAADEMLCNNACAAVQTSEQYCGSCTTQCNQTQTCEAGACVPQDSCVRVKGANPMATSGVYGSVVGQYFYCDMATSTEYASLSLAQFTAVPTGYTAVRAADLTNASSVAAFIALYNAAGGTPTLSAFANIGNCCYTVSAGVRLLLNNNAMQPAINGASACAVTMANGTYQFTVNGVVQPAVLPANYFTTNVPTEGAACGDGMNPSIVWKKTTF